MRSNRSVRLIEIQYIKGNITSMIKCYIYGKNVLLTWYLNMYLNMYLNIYLTILIQGVIVYCYLCPYIPTFPYR